MPAPKKHAAPPHKYKGGWRIGHGPKISTKAKAVRAYRGYMYSISHPKKK